MNIKDYLSLIWIVYSSMTHIIYTENVDVKLVEGRSGNQGKVMVRLSDHGSWKPLCARHFGDVEAAVVCRQLGYRHSLNEPNIYSTKIPDWLSRDIKCFGNETNIGQCLQDNGNEIDQCFQETDSYAAVCCSNNADFGERNEAGLFISNCAKSWLSAVFVCKALGLRLTELDDSHASGINNKELGPVWNGKFLSPWIWSDGCVRFTRDVDYTDTHIPYNSPGICFQICGQTPGTLFVLSGTICRCLPYKDYIVAVKPVYCPSLCPGDSERYCGHDKRVYWNLYKIGSEDDDFSVYSTQPNDTRQCAGLVQNTHNKHKLRSQPCHFNYGYICSEFKKENSTGYIPLRAPKVNISSARRTCRNKTEIWKLAGSGVVTSTLFTNVKSGFWVDIESSMVSIYQTNNIDPDHCQTAIASQQDEGLVYQLADCRQNKYLFTCSSGAKTSQTTRRTQSTVDRSRTTELNTVILDDGLYTNTQTVTVDTSSIELWQVVIAVLIGVLAASLLVIIFICWKKRRRRSRNDKSNCQNDSRDSNQGYNVISIRRTSGEYDVISDVNTDSLPLNVYEELSNSTTTNTYNELNIELHNLKSQGDPPYSDDVKPAEKGDVGRKESLKMKTSYSFPQDSVRDKVILRQQDSSAIDSKYSYPYDTLEKTDFQHNSSNKDIIEENENG